ncbi:MULTISPECIES: response regulator [unclassified Uliginosibacterium]|uniref:response regulator n=1 Tax=unclassified Uliginosibacterium TaxID=2621521 RepID=UPI000C7A97C8|nr:MULTISPECIES: response regulator [unclassified Uliginosibacterium]MDO6387434.1 response regulator [Uliginosibacterium sp. 31-12]PLK47061.1 excisionase [Uliginosibacterium sp. TH139]
MSDAVQPGGKPDREFCSTSDAAQMLGVSLGTVQQMVENGLLDAWKTAGGHRRIRVTSVEAFLRKRQAGPVTTPAPSTELRVLIAEDDRLMQALYEKTVATWEMPIKVKIVASGFEGLMEIGRNPPDLLVADLVMPDLDGFAMIRKLRDDPQLAGMDIIVVTGLTAEDIEEQGGLPEDVLIYGKPIPFRELKGYIQARLMQMQRRAVRP